MSFYLMHRGWMKNPAFAMDDRPFPRALAWLWLIEEAAWSERAVNLSGRTELLRRGQVAHAYRYMAEQWRWSRPAVERFIARLKAEGMIETTSETGRLVITICNYDKYQTFSQQPETLSETPARRQRDASETRVKEGKTGKEGNLVPTEPVSVPADLFGNGAVVPLPPDDVQRAVDLWNALAQELSLPRVTSVNPDRRKTIRRCLSMEVPYGGLDGWRLALEGVRRSPWWRGESGDFVGRLDYLTRDRNYSNLVDSGLAEPRPRPKSSNPLAGMEKYLAPEFPAEWEMEGYAEAVS